MKFVPLLTALLLCWACNGTVPETETKTEPVDDFVEEVFATGLKGLSGLCYNRSKTALIAACDNGKLWEVGFDGHVIRQLPFSGKNDFEGLAMDHTTGRIFLADEGTMKIWELMNETTLSLVCTVDVPGAAENKGIEGVAYGKGILYVVNQENPKLLIRYSVDTGSELGRTEVTYASFLSDICYDDTDDTLWIVDSKLKLITHRTLSGVMIASQEVRQVEKAEALLVDRAKGTAWVGCDETGRLYKFKLTI